MLNKLKGNSLFIFLVISIGTYLVFFSNTLNPDLTMYSGKDSTRYHYPTMYYLYEKLNEGEFPFWTERIFSGYPIYAQVEWGYLNPINIGATYLFGPIVSNKLLHLSFYIAGSLGMFLLLKRKGSSLLGIFAANLIYFFSFLILFHQQHFGITKTLYLLPLLIYFTDSAVRKKQLKHVVFAILTVTAAVYLGSFQAVLIILVAQLLYLLAQKTNLKFLLKYYLLLIFFCTSAALPLIIPAMELFKQSNRSELSYIEGSFNTFDIANFAFPFTYGSENDYFGELMFKDHFKHETYVYFGITALILALVGYANTDSKTKRFTNLTVISALLLVFIRYIPVLNTYIPPPISLFRYWGRFAVVIPFVSALLVADTLSKKEFKFSFKLEVLKIPSLILLASTALWLYNAEIKSIAYVFKENFRFDYYFYVWFLIAFLTVVLIKSKIKFKIEMLTLLLAFDLIFFGSIVVRNDFIEVSNLVEDRDTIENQRKHTSDASYDANKGLYYKDWGYFGYTPLAPDDYIKYLKSLGVTSEKVASTEIDLSHMENIIIPSSTYQAEVTEQQEGKITAIIKAPLNTTVRTYIRNYKDWKVLDNGVPVVYDRNQVFIDLPIRKGVHTIEFTYIPTTFYNAMAISIGLLLGGTIYLYLNKNARSL